MVISSETTVTDSSMSESYLSLSKTAGRPKSESPNAICFIVKIINFSETNVTVDTKNDLPPLSNRGRQAGRSKSKY